MMPFLSYFQGGSSDDSTAKGSPSSICIASEWKMKGEKLPSDYFPPQTLTCDDTSCITFEQQQEQQQQQNCNSCCSLMNNTTIEEQGGSDEQRPARLYQIKRSDTIRGFNEVPVTHESLNEEEALILDTGDTIYTWLGRDCPDLQKVKATEAAFIIACCRKNAGGTRQVYDVQDDDEGFWKLLGSNRNEKVVEMEEEEEDQNKSRTITESTNEKSTTTATSTDNDDDDVDGPTNTNDTIPEIITTTKNDSENTKNNSTTPSTKPSSTPKVTKMYVLTTGGCNPIVEVPTSLSSLQTDEVGLIQTETTIFVWLGKESIKRDRDRGLGMGQIQSTAGGAGGKSGSSKQKEILVVMEGEEKDAPGLLDVLKMTI
jgi:hypothetical protein